MSLDWATLRSLNELTDATGVLSVYVTLDRHQPSEPDRSQPWELRLRHGLEQVRDQARDEASGGGDRDLARRVAARIDQLAAELEHLVDPTTSGVGRALFAPVGDAAAPVLTVSLQVPLSELVVRRPRAYLRPLLAAWSEHGPAGAVSVSADTVRAVDLRFGATEVVGAFEYQQRAEQRQLRGPAAANPALSQQSSSQHDLYERRADDKLLRHLRTLGPRLADFAKDREWGELVLTGEAALVQAVREGLPPRLSAEVITLDHPVNSTPPPKLAGLLAPALADARRRRHRGLAEQARAGALSAGNGTCGLSDTLGALREGRVAHLLLAADGRWTGRRGPDGLVAAPEEIPPGADPDRLVPEPHLDERMIELAFDTSAEVTMLAPEAGEPLAEAGGVGALLRW